MEQITELLAILGDRPLVLPDNQLGKKITRLLKWIKTQDNPTDAAAIEAMTKKSGNAEYRKLKYHLRLHLLNSITATSTLTIAPEVKRKKANEQLWHMMSGLLAAPELYSRHQGYRLIEEVIKTAESHNLQDPLTLGVIFKALYLAPHGIGDNEVPSSTAISELYNSYLRGKIRNNTTLSTYMNKAGVSTSEKIASLKSTINELEGYAEFNYFPLEGNKLYLQMKLAVHESDLSAAKSIYQKATKLWGANSQPNTSDIPTFQLNLLRCYAKSDQVNEGIDFSSTILPLIPDENVHKYGLLELSTLLCMKASRFRQAKDLFQQAINHPFYQQLSNSQKETITIIEAYLSLMLSSGILREDKNEGRFSKFRIHRFMNNLVFSQKEKGFRNTHLLIIKVLDHCLNRRHQDFNYTEAIKKYVQRHLQDLEHTRTKNFLLALVQYPEHGYNLRMTMQHARHYLAKMQEVNSAKQNTHAYQEIIPYEKLWELVTTYKPHTSRY